MDRFIHLRKTPGTYVLVLEVIVGFDIISDHYSWYFQNGFYLYFGSAKRSTSTSLGNRLNRHFLREKNLHWHIDYLTSHEKVVLHQAYYKTGKKETECQNLTILANQFPMKVIKNFGNSDCKQNCGGHLAYLIDTKMNFNTISKVFMDAKWLEYLTM